MTLENKVIELIEDFFKKYKIKYSKYDNFNLWLIHYFNFRLKFIGTINRSIKISAEINNVQLDGEYKIALETIIEKIKKGMDINPYQSINSFNSDYDDGLFNDWGIHHLHLSNTKKNNSDYFLKRSSKLLFIRFTDTDAYFIDIYQHKEKPLWGKKDLIRKIRNNWPDLLKDKEAGMIFVPDLDDGGIEELRKKGYLFGINVDGVGYLLLGHGQASSGDNIMANRLSGEVTRWIGLNKERFFNDKKNFIIELKNKLYMY